MPMFNVNLSMYSVEIHAGVISKLLYGFVFVWATLAKAHGLPPHSDVQPIQSLLHILRNKLQQRKVFKK